VSDAITIRLIRPPEFPVLWALLREMGRTDSEESVRDRVADISKDPHHFLSAAFAADVAVGYVWAQDYGPHLRSGQRVVRLHDLYVAPNSRRLGIGARLFVASRDWAEEHGATWLQWQAGREALAFYAQLGLKGEPCPDPEHPFFEISLTGHQ
jgi:GNAT superfamily N-acetyltransferase